MKKFHIFLCRCPNCKKQPPQNALQMKIDELWAMENKALPSHELLKQRKNRIRSHLMGVESFMAEEEMPLCVRSRVENSNKTRKKWEAILDAHAGAKLKKQVASPSDVVMANEIVGMLVYRADQVMDESTEAFIL